MLGAQKKGLRSNPASRWPRSRPFGNAVAGVPPVTSVVPLGGRRRRRLRGDHFNHPRRRKYHIGTSALATISSSAYG